MNFHNREESHDKIGLPAISQVPAGEDGDGEASVCRAADDHAAAAHQRVALRYPASHPLPHTAAGSTSVPAPTSSSCS
jgi:hypothetical protein